MSAEVANELSKKIINAKNFYDRSLMKRKSSDIVLNSKKLLTLGMTSNNNVTRSTHFEMLPSQTLQTSSSFNNTLNVNENNKTFDKSGNKKSQETSFTIDYR